MKCFPWAWHTFSPVTSKEYITVQLVHFSSGPIFDSMKLYSTALTSGTPPPSQFSITSFPPTTGTLTYMGHPPPPLIFTVLIRSGWNDPWLLPFNFTNVSTTEWWNTCTTCTCTLTNHFPQHLQFVPILCSVYNHGRFYRSNCSIYVPGLIIVKACAGIFFNGGGVQGILNFVFKGRGLSDACFRNFTMWI